MNSSKLFTVKNMAWLPNRWSKIVVPFEERIEEDDEEKFDIIATSFLLNYKETNFLLTCKHVVEDKDNLFITFNSRKKDGEQIRFSLEDFSKKMGGWEYHDDPNVDVAVLEVKIDFEKLEVNVLNESLFDKVENCLEGFDIFFLGYPLGLTSLTKRKPVVRSGIIALVLEDKTFFIDGNVYPGSSGSPVFLKPSLVNWKTPPYGVGKLTPPNFIGLTSGFLPYRDIAVSKHTKKPKVVFEENSGLGKVFSTNIIMEILEKII